MLVMFIVELTTDEYKLLYEYIVFLLGFFFSENLDVRCDVCEFVYLVAVGRNH